MHRWKNTLKIPHKYAILNSNCAFLKTEFEWNWQSDNFMVQQKTLSWGSRLMRNNFNKTVLKAEAFLKQASLAFKYTGLEVYFQLVHGLGFMST